MRLLKFSILFIILKLNQVSSYWEMGTTTPATRPVAGVKRTAFFVWPWCYPYNQRWFISAFWFGADFTENYFNQANQVIAGISIDQIPLSVAMILNYRVLVSSYNYLDPYMNRQYDVRIWALGRYGEHNSPFRYRVYRIHRLVPVSTNPEHCHGVRCAHQPRHDVCIIISKDQMYISDTLPYHQYAWRTFLMSKYSRIQSMWIGGSGYENMHHIYDNFYIRNKWLYKRDIVDCSRYLPKWWGKFICVNNTYKFPGVQNGAGIFTSLRYDDDGGSYLYAIGCFEIRYNEERILVFTDLRYYMTKIYHYGSIVPGAYYEYAYPQWGAKWSSWLWDSAVGNDPYIPRWQVRPWSSFNLG